MNRGNAEMNNKEMELNLHGNASGVRVNNLKKRKPILAFLLSLLTPGLGQLSENRDTSHLLR
jgi:hypothetical protein